MDANNISGMLRSVLENPEMLKSAIGLASKIKDSNIFGSLLGGSNEDTKKDEQKNNMLLNLLNNADKNNLGDSTEHQHENNKKEPSNVEDDNQKNDAGNDAGYDKTHSPGSKERVILLKALRPYLSESRREKVDFIIKIINLLEVAEGIGLSGLKLN